MRMKIDRAMKYISERAIYNLIYIKKALYVLYPRLHTENKIEEKKTVHKSS